MFNWFRNRRRRRLVAQPFPAQWLTILRDNVRAYNFLSADQQAKLQRSLRIMAAERTWEGCGGLKLTDEIKVTIAGQACLLLLGVAEGYYFDGLPSILVYPAAYATPTDLQSGFVVDEDQETYGESWHRGPIVLSWQQALEGGRDPRDGRNLVLHEFAHHLDGLDGATEGSPPLSSREQERRWATVTQREFARLDEQARQGEETLLDHYGASNPAEFFAVCTECFFERPVEMRKQHRELYNIVGEL